MAGPGAVGQYPQYQPLDEYALRDDGLNTDGTPATAGNASSGHGSGSGGAIRARPRDMYDEEQDKRGCCDLFPQDKAYKIFLSAGLSFVLGTIAFANPAGGLFCASVAAVSSLVHSLTTPLFRLLLAHPDHMPFYISIIRNAVVIAAVGALVNVVAPFIGVALMVNIAASVFFASAITFTISAFRGFPDHDPNLASIVLIA